jgi:hypothetical protein
MCLTPIKIKAKQKQDGMVRSQGHAIVPCGKCGACKNKRANAWIFRLQQQEKVHISALFVTLTYSAENIRLTSKGFMTLDKRDVQLFMKRLRWNTGRKHIKYYACGEYGTDSWRPHYHAIMYDVTHDEIINAWGLGHTYIGTVTGASIGYTTKYICKDKRVPAHANDDRIPEFSLMSKNLGKNYLTPQMTNWHVKNSATYVVVPGGKKQPLPRYYRDFIFTEEHKQKLFIQNQNQRVENFDEAVRLSGGTTAYYRERYEAIKHSQYLYNVKQRTERNKI